jgi:hypothetical protein
MYEWTIKVKVELASPTAKYFPSGLKLTQVAALIFSLMVHGRPPGESPQSWALGDGSGEPPKPASRKETAVRLRLSFWVGVEGPPYMDAEGLMGFVVGRAR